MASPIYAIRSDPAGAAGAAGAATDVTAPSTDVFLQLLVAQIKNQDPLNPTDSVQFVSQLAQFSQLEQLIAIRQDLDGKTATTNDTKTNSSDKTSATTQRTGL